MALFGKKKKKQASDFQGAADEFVAHFDRLFEAAIEQASKIQSTASIDAVIAALRTIEQHTQSRIARYEASNGCG